MSQKIGVTLTDECFADLMKAYELYLKECQKDNTLPLSVTGYAAVMLNFGVQTKFKIIGTD